MKKMMKMMKMKTKYDKAVFEPTLALPLAMILVTGLLFLGGLIFIYAQQEEAFQTMTYSEARWLSSAVDPSRDPEENIVLADEYSTVSVILSTEGEPLFTPGKEDETPQCFYSLIGYPGMGPRYLTEAAAASLYQADGQDVSLLTGLKRSGTDQVVLPISMEVQSGLYQFLVEQGIEGSVFAYDTETGRVKAMVSRRSEDETNLNLHSVSPGSTEKILSTLLAARQKGDGLLNFTATCSGAFTAPDGGIIRCTGVHGALDIHKALGYSCNCFFAALAQSLDITMVKADLRELGFLVDENGTGERLTLAETGDLFRVLPKDQCYIQLGDQWDFSGLFSMIGQTSISINPCLFTEIIAGIAEGDNTPASACFEYADVRVLFPDHPDQTALDLTRDIWAKAFSSYYGDEFGSFLRIAKTGTTQIEQPDGGMRIQKNLTGIVDTCVFYIVYENYQTSEGTLDSLPVDAAKLLAEYLAKDADD